MATLFIVAAPSGAGKTSLVKALTESLSDIQTSVSCTTRVARPREVDGVNYFFIDDAKFKAMINADEFLEYAEVFGHYKGTPKAWVDKKLAAGVDVVLEIDWQGAQSIRQLYPDSITVFVLPPSKQALEKRLYERDQDSPEVIAQRMAAAQSEMSHYREFDYLVVNDDFDQALKELQAIVGSAHLRLTPQARHHQGLLAELLEKV